MQEEDIIEHTNVVCLHSSMHDDDILEHTNVQE